MRFSAWPCAVSVTKSAVSVGWKGVGVCQEHCGAECVGRHEDAVASGRPGFRESLGSLWSPVGMVPWESAQRGGMSRGGTSRRHAMCRDAMWRDVMCGETPCVARCCGEMPCVRRHVARRGVARRRAATRHVARRRAATRHVASRHGPQAGQV